MSHLDHLDRWLRKDEELQRLERRRARQEADDEAGEDALLTSVHHNGYVIQNLSGPQRTPAICLAAVQQNGFTVQFLTAAQRTPEVCLAAVRQHGMAVRHLSAAQRTPEVCLAAVRQFGFAVQFLTDAQRTPEVCLAAIQQDAWAIDYLKPEQCIHPQVVRWIKLRWALCLQILGRDRARLVAQAIVQAHPSRPDPHAGQDGDVQPQAGPMTRILQLAVEDGDAGDRCNRRMPEKFAAAPDGLARAHPPHIVRRPLPAG